MAGEGEAQSQQNDSQQDDKASSCDPCHRHLLSNTEDSMKIRIADVGVLPKPEHYVHAMNMRGLTLEVLQK